MSNLRFGGGISVARNLMAAVIPLRTNDHFTLICPQDCGYETLTGWNVEIIYVPGSFHSLPWVKYWYNHQKLPAIVKEKKIDKIVSLGNVAFPAEGIPQLLLIQNAWLVYPFSLAWKRTDAINRMKNRIMVRYIARHLKYATSYALQTPIMEQRFLKRFKTGDKKTYIVPNSFTPSTTPDNTLPDYDKRPIRLLMLSKYYAYKDFSVLLPLAMIIKKKGLNIEIYLTIDKKESVAANWYLTKVKILGLSDVIHTIGHVEMDDVGKTIQRYHGVLLPTFLESFSGTYVEAMAYGRPLFTTDIDFARAICGDAAFYFRSNYAHGIADIVMEAFKNKVTIEEKTKKGKEVIATMHNWQQIGLQFSKIIDRFE